MTIENIQTLNDGTAHYRQVTPFDGVVFILYFDFNTRDRRWYISIHDSEDNPIAGCVGRKIVVNWPTISGATAAGRPAGGLLSYGAAGIDPDLLELGKEVILHYIPETDLEAIEAEQ